MARFLASAAGLYSIFVLFDHMDWLADKPELMDKEWRWILDRARPGARIIGRFSGRDADLPEFAARRLEFDPETTARLHMEDRVGTDGSFPLARLTS